MTSSGSMAISVELLAKLDKFNRGLSQGQKSLTKFSGFVLTAFSIGALATFGKEIMSVTGNFEHGMARVAAITGATGDELKGLSDIAKKMGETTQYTAVQSAKALEFLGMAGLSAAQSIKALPNVLNLATAGAIGLAEAADIVTNVMSGFQMSVSQLPMINDVLAKTATSANTNILELGEAMKLAAPVAAGLGISITDTATAMAIMANAGIKGSLAGTAYAGAMSRLLRQPPMVQKALSDLGVTITETSIKQDGFIGTMRKLTAAGVNNTQMSKIMGLHWKALLPIVNATDEQIKKVTATIDNYNGAAKRLATDGMGAFRKSTNEVKSSVEGLMIKLGEGGLIQVGTKVNNILTLLARNGIPLIKVMGSLATGVVAYKIATSGAAASTTIFSGALKVARVAALALNTAVKANPMGVLIGVAVALVGVLWTLKDAFDAVDDSIEGINKKISSNVDLMEEYFKILTDVNSSEALRSIAMKEINERYSEYLPNLIKEGDSLETITKLRDASTEAIKRKIFFQKKDAAETAIVNKRAKEAADSLEKLTKNLTNRRATSATILKIKNDVEELTEEFVKLESNSKKFKFVENYFKDSDLPRKYINIVRAAFEDLSSTQEQYQEDIEETDKKFKELADGLGIKLNPTPIIIDIKLNLTGDVLDEIDDVLDIEDLGIEEGLDKAISYYQKALKKASSLPEYDMIKAKLKELKEELKTLKAPQFIIPLIKIDTGDVLDEIDDVLEIDDAPVGVLGRIRAELKKLNEEREKSKSIGDIKHYTDQIDVLKEKINSLTGKKVDNSNKEKDANKESIKMLNAMSGAFGSVAQVSQDFHADEIGSWLNLTSAILTSMSKILPVLFAKSIAGATAAGSDVPFPGNLIAIAAGIGAVTAAFSSLPMFAEGGVVGGNSFKGDKIIARVNSGEVILNQDQQNKVWGMMNNSGGSSGYGGSVDFKIKGDYLFGVLNNTSRKKNNRR